MRVRDVSLALDKAVVWHVSVVIVAHGGVVVAWEVVVFVEELELIKATFALKGGGLFGEIKFEGVLLDQPTHTI